MDVNRFLKCEMHTDLGKYQLNSTNNVNKCKGEKFSPYNKLFLLLIFFFVIFRFSLLVM